MKIYNLKIHNHIIKIFVILFIVSSIAFYGLHRKGKEYYNNVIFDNLSSKAQILSVLLDTKGYEAILNSNEKDGSPLYEKILSPIKEAHSRIKGIRYVYTAYKGTDGKIYFGLDTAERKDLDHDGVIDHSDFRSEYAEASSSLKQVFIDKKMIITKEPYSDKWGSFIGAFIPIFDKNNNVISAFAVEILYDSYKKDLNNFSMLILIFYIGNLCVILCLCYFVNVSANKAYDQLELSKNLEYKDYLLEQESKMADIGKLMAGITHEINNPLAVIYSAAKVCSMQIDLDNKDIDTTYLQKNLGKIQSQTDKIVAIIKSMKSLVRDGSKDPINEEDLNQLISESMVLLNHRLKDHTIELKCDSIPKGTMIPVRATQFQQIAINLITNSLDAISNMENPWIRISYLDDKHNHIIRFQDSGLGIPGDLIEKIFKGFYTSKKQGEGSGMGLLICKKIIESHNGKFNYIPDTNTTFEIVLPKQHLT